MKHRELKRTMAIALGALALATAQAHAAAPGHDDRFFARLDANGDGFLSTDEVKQRSGYAKAFASADEDRDGRLNPDEFVKAEAIYERQNIGKFVDDTLLTTKVKASLLAHMKTLRVHVETWRGQVLLSGFVENEDDARHAVQLASAVDGVLTVKDGLVAKR